MTKQFWQLKRTEVNAMIRVFGPPSLLITFGCAEYNSADISDALKLANSSLMDSHPNISQVCCEDPITVRLEVIIKGECLGKVSSIRLPITMSCCGLRELLSLGWGGTLLHPEHYYS